MRHVISLIVVAILTCCVFVLQAQRVLSEATLRYKITISIPYPDSIQYIVSLKGGQGRTEMISALGTESTIYDPRSASGYIIKEYGGTKLLVNANPNEWIEHNRIYHELVFSIEAGTFPTGGFSCKKATAQLPSGKKITVYYDPNIVLPNYEYHLAFAGLKGLPVSFELDQGWNMLKYELVALNTDPVSYSRFQVPGKGYRTLSYEELKRTAKHEK